MFLIALHRTSLCSFSSEGMIDKLTYCSVEVVFEVFKHNNENNPLEESILVYFFHFFGREINSHFQPVPTHDVRFTGLIYNFAEHGFR